MRVLQHISVARSILIRSFSVFQFFHCSSQLCCRDGFLVFPQYYLLCYFLVSILLHQAILRTGPQNSLSIHWLFPSVLLTFSVIFSGCLVFICLVVFIFYVCVFLFLLSFLLRMVNHGFLLKKWFSFTRRVPKDSELVLSILVFSLFQLVSTSSFPRIGFCLCGCGDVVYKMFRYCRCSVIQY